MELHIEDTNLADVKLITPGIFEDQRGFFFEAFRGDVFEAAGLPNSFVQSNYSGSHRGVLRGLHFQWSPPMGKLMRVITGSAFLVAVDIRLGSPTLGRWWGEVISAAQRKMVWAPAGFARGFYVVSEFAEIEYCCTGVYNSQAESAIRWNDPQLAIDWPISGHVGLSTKDSQAAGFQDWLARPESESFTFS